MNPVDPFRYGTGVPLALSLYREALYWALRAQPEAEGFTDLAAAWQGTPRALLETLAGGRERVHLIEQRLVLEGFLHTAELQEEEQRNIAWTARPLVGALIERAEGNERTLRALYFQRWFRAFMVAVAVLLAVVGIWTSSQRLLSGPNLAAGKPWQASSSYKGFNPAAHVCDGNVTRILFHTNEEENPWFQVDMGVVNQVAVVEITNRTDGYQGRAVPLVVELSTDSRTWTEVARRTDTFNTWKAKFSPRKARYVRVKAQRRTFLHLETVVVRAK